VEKVALKNRSLCRQRINRHNGRNFMFDKLLRPKRHQNVKAKRAV
jgi:hypothetical protein